MIRIEIRRLRFILEDVSGNCSCPQCVKIREILAELDGIEDSYLVLENAEQKEATDLPSIKGKTIVTKADDPIGNISKEKLQALRDCYDGKTEVTITDEGIKIRTEENSSSKQFFCTLCQEWHPLLQSNYYVCPLKQASPT